VIAQQVLRDRELQRRTEQAERDAARAQELEEVANFAVDRVEELEREVAEAGLRNVLLAREIGRLRREVAKRRRRRRLLFPTLLVGVALGAGAFSSSPLLAPHARAVVAKAKDWFAAATMRPESAIPVAAPVPAPPVVATPMVATPVVAPPVVAPPVVAPPVVATPPVVELRKPAPAPPKSRMHPKRHEKLAIHSPKRRGLGRSVARCGSDPLCGLSH
jgi:hypothetical protein